MATVLKACLFGGAVLVGLAALHAGAYAEPRPAMMDFVTHNEVVVKAAPSDIWPHIIKLSDWKKGDELILIHGNSEELGARFKALEGDPQTVAFYVENVELVTRRLRTIRLSGPDGTLIGYASWHLIPQRRSTLVQYNVYCWVPVPLTTANGVSADVAEAKKSYYDANVSRFTQELVGLKKLVEGHRREIVH